MPQQDYTCPYCGALLPDRGHLGKHMRVCKMWPQNITEFAFKLHERIEAIEKHLNIPTVVEEKKNG